jgi:hypothetical protein
MLSPSKHGAGFFNALPAVDFARVRSYQTHPSTCSGVEQSGSSSGS